MTKITRAEISRIVNGDPRAIRAWETMQDGVADLTGANGVQVDATQALQDATVVTLSPNDTFNNERVLQVANGLQLTDTGPNGNLIISLLYQIITNGGYRLTFNLVSDTNLDLPPTGKVVESQLGGNTYATDALASAAGFQIGEIYKGPAGAVKWRQT